MFYAPVYMDKHKWFEVLQCGGQHQKQSIKISLSKLFKHTQLDPPVYLFIAL